MRRLSIDPGARRVGLAWSDGETSIALPLPTLDGRDKGLIETLRAQIAALGVQEVIIGLPLNMDGSEGEGAKRSRSLATQIEQAANVAVVLWDERLTTVLAQRQLRDVGIGARDQKDKVDQVAATILLQSYLDSHTEAAWDEDQVLPDAPPKAGSRRKRNSSRGR